MPDTPEEKEKRKKLLHELWKLEEELLIDLTQEEVAARAKQVRKEMAIERDCD